MPQRGLPAMDVVELGAEVRDRTLQPRRGGIAAALVLELAIPEHLHHEPQLVLARSQSCHVSFTSEWMPHAASNPCRSGVVIRATYRFSGAALPRRSTDTLRRRADGARIAERDLSLIHI